MNNFEVSNNDYSNLYKLIATNYDLGSLATRIQDSRCADYNILSLRKITQKSDVANA